jgi:hypothetical protein
MLVDWQPIVEDDLRIMIRGYYEHKGHVVDDVHRRSELGADLLINSREGDRILTVLIKISPGQDDLGQITTALRNYGPPIAYFFTGSASGPFLAGFPSDGAVNTTHNEEGTEKLMIEGESHYVFYYGFRYHEAIIGLADLVATIFRRCKGLDTGVQPSERVSREEMLDFYEGILQAREIVNITLNDMIRYSHAIQGAETTDGKERIRLTGARLLKSRLDLLTPLYSEKIEQGLSFPRAILEDSVYGYDCWGTTQSGWFSPTKPVQGGAEVPIPIDDHREIVMNNVLHGYGYEWQQFGINEAAACLQSTLAILNGLKKGTKKMILLHYPSLR